MIQKHENRMAISFGQYAWCVSASHRMEFSLTWTRSLPCHVRRSVPARSKRTEPNHHCCLLYTRSTIEGTHPPMNFSRFTSFRSKTLNLHRSVLFGRIRHLVQHLQVALYSCPHKLLTQSILLFCTSVCQRVYRVKFAAAPSTLP